MSVKPTLTAERRSRRGVRERSTEEYLGAVRRMLRAAAERAGAGDEPELAALIALRGDVDEAIARAVAMQREQGGKSWAMIAWATGTTRQAAQARWGRR